MESAGIVTVTDAMHDCSKWEGFRNVKKVSKKGIEAMYVANAPSGNHGNQTGPGGWYAAGIAFTPPPTYTYTPL